jgi:hypothetical protein
MSARKQARQVHEVARQRCEAARKGHESALASLERTSDRRDAFAANVASPELDRFVALFARFADYEFDGYEGPAAPIVGAVREAQLRELKGSAGDVAKSAALGGVSGGIAAAGAWGAVTTWGTASTGTAIASLNGVAASNAALAALGGGSLATGGGGIAAGTAALGGIAAAPVLVIGAAVYWHLGRRELAKAQSNAADMDATRAKLDADKARIVRVRQSVARLDVAAQLLTGALALRLGEIGGWPLRALVNDHTPAEQGHLARTVLIAETLSIVVTTPAWTANGEPSADGQRVADEAELVLRDEPSGS